MNDLGDITRCYTMTFERESKHTAGKLWRSITNSEEVSRWMKYPAKIELRVGGDYYLDFSRSNAGALDGVIVRVEPERRLAYVWGLSVLEWTIEPTDEGCRYEFVHHGQPPPADVGEEDIPVGWHLWLDDLHAHLDGISVDASAARLRWSELEPIYSKLRDAALGLD